MSRYFPLIIVFFPAFVLAAGIEVTPAKLFGPGEIVVANPTADVQMFEVYADEFTDIIEINPVSFVLEAGTRKNVSVKATVEKQDTIITTNISVVGKPLADSRFTAGTGVKIPFSTTSVPNKRSVTKNLMWYLGGFAFGVALAVISSVVMRQQKQTI